jgi:hypothetical protein
MAASTTLAPGLRNRRHLRGGRALLPRYSGWQPLPPRCSQQPVAAGGTLRRFLGNDRWSWPTKSSSLPRRLCRAGLGRYAAKLRFQDNGGHLRRGGSAAGA